ncbi:SagB/ThcOx family dehydrogenase [Thermogladius sp. 4427co]|uniref:SagB/ThcOx family dehydrogenase n=1 Tax=Thermogladius sp. 4427co TaxID=3450718 RepID=UPI003F7AFBEB
MSKHILASFLLTLAIIAYLFIIAYPQGLRQTGYGVSIAGGEVLLPLPKPVSNMSIEETILLRRSIREYTGEPLDLERLAVILWAAYGVTEPRLGFRSVPSAGATYPLELYVVVGARGVLAGSGVFLDPGVYKYDPHKHVLRLVKSGDFREELARAALEQPWVEKAPVSIVVFAVFERTTRIYGERGRVRYVPMEVGHLGQNVYLVATALGYGCVVVGAFYDDQVKLVVGAGVDEEPMYIIPIGVPAQRHYTSFEDVWEYILSARSRN